MESAASGASSERILAAGSCLAFGEIEPPEVVVAAREVVADGERLLHDLEAASVHRSVDELIAQLEYHHDRLERVYTIGHQFQSVCDNADWRAAWAEAQPILTEFVSRWGQSRSVYDTLQTLRATGEHPAARARLLDSMVLDMKLSGVALEGTDRDQFRQNQSELATLSTRYAQTALDARKAWSKVLTDPAHVEGMPANWRRIAADGAGRDGHPDASMDDGPWRVSLDNPIALPVLQHCRYRPLREEVRRHWMRVGADEPHNNSPTLVRILELRREQAQLLGFGSYIELSMARKMAGDQSRVESLVDRIVRMARPGGASELEQLEALAQAAGAPEGTDFQVWDERFWAQRDREAKVGLSDDDLRPFFAYEQVRSTLFDLVERLFGMRFIPRPALSVWHEDVAGYAMVDTATNEEKAFLYVDPYARPQTKRAGAWMMPLVGRSARLGPAGQPRLPAAVICCNQTPPVGDAPSLMSFREVTTLFHEMGHALHHMISEADDVRQAGVAGVEWDAVELPSIFLECWVYHRPTLVKMARHHETGASLPDAVIGRLLAARAHRGASFLLGQSSFTRMDFRVHDAIEHYTPEHVHALGLETLREIRTLKPLAEDRMLCSFSHLFAGGYAAGYYSYLWAGVLARDAFAAFQALDGDELAEAKLGRRWRHEVLAPGGSVHPMVLFEGFLGRAPDVAAVLNWYGLDSDAADA
jgi:oligopeptidase A